MLMLFGLYECKLMRDVFAVDDLVLCLRMFGYN